MNEIQKMIALALCGATVSIVLKKNTPEISITVSVLTGIIIFGIVASSLVKVIYITETIFTRTGIDENISKTVIKICGIGIISEYFCSIISDSGETALAKKLELGAKIVIFSYTIPIVIEVIDNIKSVF